MTHTYCLSQNTMISLHEGRKHLEDFSNNSEDKVTEQPTDRKNNDKTERVQKNSFIFIR